MKTKEEVMDFLKSNPIGKKSANKILGFLLGKEVLEKGEVVCFKRVEDCSDTISFDDFYEWYNKENNIVDGVKINGATKNNKSSFSQNGFWDDINFVLSGEKDNIDSKFKGIPFEIDYDLADDMKPSMDYKVFFIKCNEIRNKNCNLHLKKGLGMLPENKIKEEQESKYKVGDYVKITSSFHLSEFIGRIFEISAINKLNISLRGALFCVESDLEPSTKEAYDEQCRQDSIESLKEEYTKWRKDHNIGVYTKDEYDLCDKIRAYTELCLFAQWINGLDPISKFTHYIIYSKNEFMVFTCTNFESYSGCVFFHTKESAQLAIDILGKELIKKALM